MTQATAPVKNKEIADSPLRYLMQADDNERRKLGGRAVELGFPPQDLRTGNHAIDLLKWLPLVRDEMQEQGLWKPSESEPEAKKTTAKIIQLPLWPEPVRAVPNDILRSALFAAIQGKTREFKKMQTVATCEGLTIKYTGEQLDQSDLDVWEQVVHLARHHPLGTICTFKGYAFLKSIGRSTGKSNYKWLYSVLNRLSSNTVEFHHGKKIHGRGLIASFDIDEETSTYKITIDADTARLYTAGWTGIHWEQRQLMRGKPLALWLHGYYASHAAPLPVKVETLHRLCGSKEKILYNFRHQLRKALDELKSCGAVADWQIDPETDLVTVDRGAAITDSQRRHLAKPTRKRSRKPEF